MDLAVWGTEMPPGSNAFQLEGSTPFLELPKPLICASASKMPREPTL